MRTMSVVHKILRSDFIRNTVTLASGTTISQIVSIGTAPLLYRIYEKEDYGTLGTYMALTGVLGILSTFQYTNGILLEEHDADAKNILSLTKCINILFVILLLVVVLLTFNRASYWLNNPGIKFWLLMLPVSIFFSAQNEMLRYWANRKKEYKLLSFNSVFSAVLVPGVSLSLGLLTNGPIGLFAGLLVSQITPALLLSYRLNRKYGLHFSIPPKDELRRLISKYSRFPKYSLPAEFINRFSNQLPVFMLGTYSGPAIVGTYNLCVRMLGLPTQLIAGALSEVFRQRATEDYNRFGNCRKLFAKTFKTLSAIGILPTIFIIFFGEELFALVFGEKWREAGQIAQIISCLYFLKLVVSPLSFLYYLKGRLQEDLFNNVYFVISTLAIFYFTLSTGNYFNALIGYTINYCFIYIIVIYRSYTFSKGEVRIL